MTLPRKLNNRCHSHPQIFRLREYSTTPATERAQAFGIIRFRAASCAVLERHKINSVSVLAPVHDLGLASSQITLRTRASSSFDIFRLSIFAFVGVASCRWSNRAHCRQFGQGERSEIYFRESLGEKIFLLSAASALRFGGMTSPASFSRSASARPSVSPTSTSPARRRRLMRRLWSFSTNCGPVNGPDISCGGVEGHATSGSPSKRYAPVARSHRGAGIEPGPQEFIFSSGDGLGNHQPGSITWGGQVRTPAPSGRARDRARCPAVARSSLRRVA
jgi:hypothetical protein